MNKLRALSIAAIAISVISFSNSTIAAETYQRGKIINITSGKSGLLIKLDSGVPNNCADSPYGWIKVLQEHTAMTSVVLMMWSTDKKDVTVYTDPAGDGGYCVANQIDPM
ncbi:hypothetical protein FLL45_08115 [Aliikangiella marina]|uniref:Uncharacterized protein n=1 Tax=Aliikangiella marina TaxID=1712262 RepID=A0A545TCH7_9GAMM|nr:hypothetical protein [Aliikangiella marina]TQV74915.1 hypothetical protein FLL45_08115 [Aliikangiella marina]